MDRTYQKRPITEPRPPARFPQYLAALVATLGAFILGMCLGWTSTVADPLQKDEQYGFPISDSEFAWIGSLMPLGALFGAPAVGWMVTTLGRRTSIMILCIPSAVGFAMMAWAENVEMLCVGRLLSGVGGGGFTVVVPLYTSEYAETCIRGTLGTYFQLQLTLGTLFTYVVGSLVNVYWLTVLCTLVPIILGVLMMFIPESPIYYLEKNKSKEAAKALQWFRGSRYDIGCEFGLMLQNIQDVKAAKLSFFEAFSTKPAKKGLIINLGLMAFQQLSGINSVIFYTTTIFEGAGSTLNSNVETIITGVVAVVFTYISTLFVDRLGRRPLLLFSDTAMAVCTFFIGLFFVLKEQNYNVDSFNWVPITFVCVFLISFALGFGPVPWVFLSEIFPRQISGYAVSIVCSFNFLCVFLVTNLFSNINDLIGTGGSFWIFTILSFTGTAFVYFVVLETKNKTLEQVLKELSQ